MCSRRRRWPPGGSASRASRPRSPVCGSTTSTATTMSTHSISASCSESTRMRRPPPPASWRASRCPPAATSWASRVATRPTDHTPPPDELPRHHRARAVAAAEPGRGAQQRAATAAPVAAAFALSGAIWRRPRRLPLDARGRRRGGPLAGGPPHARATRWSWRCRRGRDRPGDDAHRRRAARATCTTCSCPRAPTPAAVVEQRRAARLRAVGRPRRSATWDPEPNDRPPRRCRSPSVARRRATGRTTRCRPVPVHHPAGCRPPVRCRHRRHDRW